MGSAEDATPVKDVAVIMTASEERGTMALYLSQLKDAGIDAFVHPLGNMPNMNGGGTLGYKVEKYREYALRYAEYEKIVLSDAWDVTFYGTKEELIDRIPDTYVLQAAEKNCYPDLSLSSRIPQKGPWRFINGGLAAGKPGVILEWLEGLESHPHFNPHMLDQQFFNLLLAESSPLCIIDDTTRLFFCLFGGYEELQFEKGKPINTVYGSKPLFIHANGKWASDEMFAKYKRSLL